MKGIGTRYKAKLESISVSQWNQSNLHIFHHLLTSGRLPTASDVADCLAYSIKIMDLVNRFEWISVLKYDDEFRMLQHNFCFPWSMDSHHLHDCILLPKRSIIAPAMQKFSMRPKSDYATHVEGLELCRNFNRKSGCNLESCVFKHACNNTRNGKACGESHPGFQHRTKIGGTSQ